MRSLGFAAACCLALTACNQAPTFDASSLPAYQRSLSAIKTGLNSGEQNKLQIALMTLAAGLSADYSAYALANPATIANLETLDSVSSPLTILDRLRPMIQGRTAASVIRRVADDLDYAIRRTEAQQGSADKLLAGFVIENARYFWDQGKRLSSPTLEFSIYNGSRGAISAVAVSGALTTRALPTPWVVRSVNYHFARLLQPGAEQKVTITLATPGSWTAKQLESAYDAALKLQVSNVSDADGRRLLIVNTDAIDTMRRKRDALRAG